MVAVLDIKYVVFGHRDVGAAERFYHDFGLVTAGRTEDRVFLRGAGEDPYVYVAEASDRPGLRVIGMEARSFADLEEAARFPESGPIETISWPGGGRRVRLSSPEGLQFEIVHGIAPVAPLPMRDPLAFNHAREKARLGNWQRANQEPAAVLRLGHVALTTADYRRSAEWLESRLGMRPSDILFDGTPDNALGGFFHCAGGGGWTDHHTIALFPARAANVHHSSFEVQDVDAQFLGHQFLRSRGWQPLWGVGRHILGSQIFDYWFDPSGNVVEHFTDGDLVGEDHKVEFHQVSDDSLAQWGPPMEVARFIDRLPADEKHQ